MINQWASDNGQLSPVVDPHWEPDGITDWNVLSTKSLNHLLVAAAWWCNVTILKNHGVRQWEG